MPEVVESPPAVLTLADVLQQLGNIPADRVRWHPLPGTATEEDVVEIEQRENHLCELVDGVLVEKPMGVRESLLAGALIELLRAFVRPRKLGMVLAPDGMVRLAKGLVRIPDVSFISWDRLHRRSVPNVSVLALAPDLAVEVLSPSNTPEEMVRKRREYFAAGVRLAWFVDPPTRTVAVYTAPDQFKVLTEADTLTGDPVLPGFTLPLKDLFAELDDNDRA